MAKQTKKAKEIAKRVGEIGAAKQLGFNDGWNHALEFAAKTCDTAEAAWRPEHRGSKLPHLPGAKHLAAVFRAKKT